MTRDQLFKLIAENSTSFMKEQMLRDAVDLYTEALIAAKPNVSGSLPNDEDYKIVLFYVNGKPSYFTDSRQ